MFKHSIRIALFAALLHLAPGWASILGNDTCQTLVSEGHALFLEGKPREAWDSFERARKSDPGASGPLASMAYLMLRLSEGAPADKKAVLRQQAGSAARAALAVDAHDPLAQEVLRSLQDDAPTPLHMPTLEAAQANREGEVLFVQKRYPEALAKYEQAAARDPLFSGAWVYAGDCFYSRQQWHEAEVRYRRATEIEPLNGQAWRFLSDALVKQGEQAQAHAALLGGIAAQPSQMPNWDKLETLLKHGGATLKPLSLVRRARMERDVATGKPTLQLFGFEQQKTPDNAFWMMLALREANLKPAEGAAPRSPFQVELAAWQDTLKLAADAEAAGKDKLQDPAVLTMRTLARAGQLEAAILLLMYRESYRPDFEAWKQAHPDGIEAFVATYGLRP